MLHGAGKEVDMYNFTLYMTTACNFECKYCYEDYKEQNHLNEESLVQTLEFIMNYGDKGKILLDFLGGEPLLKKDLIKQAVSYVKQEYPDRIVKYYITTNCSLMDDEFISFMKENAFTVRLSFDGNKQTHDLNRIAKDGISCYESIVDNIYKVKNSGLRYSVRMTITENTIPFMYENICFLHEQGLNSICMIMDVNLELSESLLEVFKTKISMITEYYLNEFNNNAKFALDQFDGKFFNILCDFGNKFAMCNAGVGNFKIMPDGSIYPCGFLTSDKQYKIGDIHKGVDINLAKHMAMSKFDKNDTKCLGCNIRDFCHGMKCGYMNFIRTKKINRPSDAECLCEHVFYDAIIKIFNYLLLQPVPIIRQTFGEMMDYIEASNLKLSDYGMKVYDRLVNEK